MKNNPTVEDEMKRVWNEIVKGTLFWCADCCEMHDMIQMKGESTEHCLQDECGHMIVLPWIKVFPNE